MDAYGAVHNKEARDEFYSVRDELSEMELEVLSDSDLVEIAEAALQELFEEGYSVEEADLIFEDLITEASVSYGHDTESPRAMKVKRMKGAMKSAVGKAKEKAATGAVKAFGAYRSAKTAAADKARRTAQTAKNMSAQTSRKASEVKAKAKSGIKGMIRKAADKVASGASKVAKRMSEDVSKKEHLDIAAAYAAIYEKKLDPVGQEDADIDNDGDVDKSDKYLHKRRKAIGKAMGKKSMKEGKDCECSDEKDKKKMKKGSAEVEQVDELYKGKHGQTEKEYQDSRSDAGKMISGDSKRSGANYSYKAKNTGPNPAGGSKKPQGQAKMGAKDRKYLMYRKSLLKKEGVQFSEAELARIQEIVDSWED